MGVIEVAYFPSKLLRFADRARTDTSIRDVDLWRLADRETGNIVERAVAYRHALTHADRLEHRHALVRCPDCGRRFK